MCLAIVNFAGILPYEYFETADFNNPDGMGLLWSDGEKLNPVKTVGGVKEFYDVYKAVRALTDGAILIHFRMATHGAVNTDNCHPFITHDELGFIHNGIISGYGSKDKSDTRDFNEKILQKLDPDFYQCSDRTMLLEELIGSNKLCFLNLKGEAWLINGHLGSYDEESGDWFSNSSHLQSRSYYGSFDACAVGGKSYEYKGKYGGSYSSSLGDKKKYTFDDDDFEDDIALTSLGGSLYDKEFEDDEEKAEIKREEMYQTHEPHEYNEALLKYAVEHGWDVGLPVLDEDRELHEDWQWLIDEMLQDSKMTLEQERDAEEEAAMAYRGSEDVRGSKYGDDFIVV